MTTEQFGELYLQYEENIKKVLIHSLVNGTTNALAKFSDYTVKASQKSKFRTS